MLTTNVIVSGPLAIFNFLLIALTGVCTKKLTKIPITKGKRYDERNLNRLVNVGLESSINNLRNAIETSSMLNIPYDFKYRSYLKSLDDNLKNNLSGINNIYSIIKNSSKVYSNISNSVDSDLSGIENYSISLRQSAIR